MHSLLHAHRGYHVVAVVPHYVLPPTGLTSVLYLATAVTVNRRICLSHSISELIAQFIYLNIMNVV